ncbi:uncharacterized protein [Panulirus ornatus]|uniref:uncharacterized protein n=1 Tax=Panulirus ornatus TaxID=150431 RepID=UPI003A851660
MSYGPMWSYRESTSSASGYGYSRYVDCNSALALLGFILFVDILRDIVEYVVEGKGRKKRWVARDGSWAAGGGRPEPDILTFVSEGGVEHLYDALPHILVPLLEGWWELSGQGRPRQCLQQSVCQANWVLARDYGVAGRVLATLLSNVGSRAFPGEEDDLTEEALVAARTGRRGQVCEAAFPACPNLHPSHSQPLYHNASHVDAVHNPAHNPAYKIQDQHHRHDAVSVEATVQERLHSNDVSDDV